MQTVCFASDLHLFARRSSAPAHYGRLVEHAAACDRLVLGGDIFDFRWSTLASRQRTVDAALDWLQQLLADLPTTQVHYLLGNHDHVQALLDELPRFETQHPRFDWHQYYLRIGHAVFLHGDVADRPMTPQRFERRRLRSLYHGRRRRGRLSNAAYQAMLTTRVHNAIPLVIHPRRTVARRILHYLSLVGQREGVQEVFFGHTHRPVDGYVFRGVTFHNGGAPIGTAPLVLLQTEVDETHGIVAA